MTACPNGWHLPSYDEFMTLLNTAGRQGGNKLKSTNRWLDGEGSGTSGNGIDSYGFTALPAGQYFSYRNTAFYDLNTEAYFWSSVEKDINDDTPGAYALVLSNETMTGEVALIAKYYWNSIRCIKD